VSKIKKTINLWKDNANVLKLVGLVIGPLLLIIIWLYPVPGLSIQGRHALAIALFTATWWIFAVVPPVIPALLACILFMVTGTVKAMDAFSGFSNPSIWMIMFALIISKAVDSSGLGKRIAITMVTSNKLTFSRLIAVLSLLCMIVPFFIPAGPAYVALLMTLAVGLLEAVGMEKNKRSELGAAMTCFIAVLSLMMGRIPLTGSVANIISTGLVRELSGVEVTWLEWFANMCVTAPLLLVATWAYITKIYKPEVDFSSPLIMENLHITRNSLGNISRKEIKAGVIVSAALLLWMTSSLHGLGTNVVGAIIAALFLLPYVGVVNVDEFQKLPWHIFVFAGGSFSIGVVLNKTGVAAWVGRWVGTIRLLDSQSFLVIAGFLVIAVFLLHLLLETLGEVSLLTPIFLQSGILPAKAVAMLVPYGAGLYLFPYQATPIILSLGFGVCNWNDVTKYSFYICAVAILQAFLFMAIYWTYSMSGVV
jgi:anion transporter